MDIVLITQDMKDLCATVRDLVETTFITAKHLDLGKEDAFIRYTCRKAASLGKDNTPPKNQLITSENGKYKKEVYQYYKTHMHSLGGGAPNEKRVQSSSWFGSWQFKAGLTVLVLCVFGMVYGVSATKDKVQKMNEKTKPQTAQAVPVTQTAQVIPGATPEPPKPPKPQFSSDWRIAGKMTGKTGELTDKKPMVILASASGATRLISASKCTRVDYEDFCEVDGDIITRFSGHQSNSYIKEDSIPAQVAAN